MEAVRRANPKFTNFNSRSATDAVEQFCRMQRNGLPAVRIPEALIECAQSLNDAEMDLFEQWIVNPNDAKGIDASIIGAANAQEHARLVHEHECRHALINESVADPAPAAACSTDDEKTLN